MKWLSALPVLLLALSTFAQEQKEAWPAHSNPRIASENLTYEFHKMPLSGSHDIPHTGWSDDYWPTHRGSINRRWNAPGEPGFNLVQPTREQALGMTYEQLAELAPSEKFDLLRARYDYPLVKSVAKTAKPTAKDWAGICNGWAPASLNLKEPHPVVMTNADGIKIPFGSSDVKAILSYYYAYYVDSPTRQIGLRCFLPRGIRVFGRGCGDDLNAGAFHVIITNKLGIEKRGFLADVDRFREVWNQPITSFKSEILMTRPASSEAARNAVTEAVIKTDLYYGSEIDPQWQPVLYTPAQLFDKLELKYTVELDAQGKVVGGEWLSDSRPDFIWFRDKAPFTGEFAMLGDLYEAATRY
jgi:hypothetical protein